MWTTHPSNGEETAYPGYLGNFTKGLPHDEIGEVDPAAYRRLLRAVMSRTEAAFEGLPLDPHGRRYVNPQAGLARDEARPASVETVLPPAPRMDSAEHSAEACELYWMALCRDVPFGSFADDPTVAAAAAELSRFSRYGAAGAAGRITPANLFREDYAGNRAGPFVSQFLLRDVPFGTLLTEQRHDRVRPRHDYLTTFETWLRIQRGWDREFPADGRDYGERAYLATPRDLTHFVHFDAGPTPAQAFLNAALILYHGRWPVDPGNPYEWSTIQEGFATFGTPHLMELLTKVANRALRVVWFHKWYVHRRMRPEAFGGRLHNHLGGGRRYEFIDSEILNSEALDRARRIWGSYLLPQAYPEGSPMHPAYGAGHATAAGACATILKAWFDETSTIVDPLEANDDGLRLLAYRGEDAERLTVGGELTKLAVNIAVGRNLAGVHWRTDLTESLLLGEQIAEGLLREQKSWFNETHSFTLTRFDGTTVTI